MKKKMTWISISIFTMVLMITTNYSFGIVKRMTNNTAQNTKKKEFRTWQVPNISNAAEAYFSPDGKKLICNAKMKGDSSHMVYTLNIDGTDIRQINDKGEDACSFFHPDGKSIIWTSTRDNLNMKKGNFSNPKNYPQGAELYTSDLNGNQIKRLTNNKFYDAEVGYSPNGKKILFGRQIDGKMDLWVMKSDGSNQKQVTFTAEWQEGGAFFLSDNKTIIYRAWKRSDEGKRGMPMTIFTIKDDGTDLKQITTDPGTNWAPFPSSDGKHFVFIKVLQPHNFEIFLMNMETKKQTRLTFNKGFDGFPVISPDGKTLSFSSSRGEKPGKKSLNLYMMDISSLNL